MNPLYIKVHETDNVAIIVNEGGLDKGTVFSCGLELKEHVPQAHKVALSDIAQNQAIIRYGYIIGYAETDIKKGQWIDETMVRLPDAQSLDALPVANNVPQKLEPLVGYTFEGYKNKDGSVGTKNMLGITTTVQCVAPVVKHAVKIIKDELLPKYPNVDDVVAITHAYGCGVAINAPESVVPIRTIKNISQNPNFGGELMVVGLGCEKLMPDRLFPSISSENVLSLQDFKGFPLMVEAIVKMAEVKLQKLNERKRETCPASDLVVGLQCGGSDAFSGVTSNPAVGYAADLLVRAGATVMFSEVTEVRDAIHLLTPRAETKEIGEALKREMAWYDKYLDLGEVDRSANPAPGNKKGGLANVIEKSLGSVAKSGTSAIVEVLSPGERATKKGLIYAATPASDFFCGTEQLASGITLQVFTTGRGTPYGLAIAPVLKVSSRNELYRQWPDIIDFNAGGIATGEATIESAGEELFRLIIDVASGRKQAWADKWNLHNDLCVFNPAPIT